MRSDLAALSTQRFDHCLGMQQQVLGVLLEDVLASLGTNLGDKGLKEVDRDLRLATTLRCLGGIELG